MKELTLLANKYKSDKGIEHGSAHGFTELYDEYFFNIKNKKINILEIGVQDGSSLKMWFDYFPNAKIYGLDIEDKSFLEKYFYLLVLELNSNMYFFGLRYQKYLLHLSTLLICFLYPLN